MNVSKIAKISIYVGEWNHVDREKKSPANTDDTSKIDATKSDLTQEESDLLVNKFNSLKVYGWAFWNWHRLRNNFHFLK